MQSVTLRILVLSLFLVTAAHAGPNMAPRDVKVFSPNHLFYVVSLVKQKQTSIYRTDQPGPPTWVLPLYTPIPHLSNDGMHLAVPYAHGNILDDDVRPTDSLITFYKAQGSKIILSVQDVLGDPHHLEHFTDGWGWGRVRDFDKSGQLLVDLDDGKTLAIDPDHPQVKPVGRWHK